MHQAKVVDTCWECSKKDTDVNVKAVLPSGAPKDDGRVRRYFVEKSGLGVSELRMKKLGRRVWSMRAKMTSWRLKDGAAGGEYNLSGSGRRKPSCKAVEG